jgi:extradiol dioxygenase family protein
LGSEIGSAYGETVAEPILHLSIPVADLESSREFYEGVLGCRVGRVREDFIDVWFFGLQLTLQERPDQVTPLDPSNVKHFGVTFTDRAGFDALIDRVDAHGVAWLSPPDLHRELSNKLGGKLTDPSGNVLEIKYYADPSEFLGH